MRMIRLAVATAFAVILTDPLARAENWYEKSFWLLHEDHHTVGTAEVGRDADSGETSRLVKICRPDLIQIHAKGNPGWTTYPSKIGHAPPRLARDVLAIWRDVARQDGYHFSAYYNIGRDGEIMKRRPEWNRVRADGRPVERALCYHSGVAEDYLWPMVREIVAGYHPDGFWFDGSCFTIQVCYCDVCRERFKKEHGLKAPTSPDKRGWKAYKEMQRRIYREFVRETAEFIHKIDPECLVAVNWAYSVRMPEKPAPGIAYLTGDIGNRVEGLSVEAHWYDSLGVPFDLMTQISTRQRVARPEDGREVVVMAPKPAGQIEQEMAIIIANGGRYFAWDTPTLESGLTPERFEFMGKVVAPFLRARQRWCMGSERVPDVSLLHSAASHYAVNDQAKTCFTRRDNRLEGAANWLARLHLNYEIVPDWRLDAQDVRSPLLIVEHAKKLTDRSAEALAQYVKQGGRLLMTGMGPHGRELLREVCGIGGSIGPKGSEPLTVDINGRNLSLEHWLFRTELSTATALLSATDHDGQSHPLLTKNTFGRGQAYYFATPLLTAHGKNVISDELMNCVFDQVAPASERYMTTNAPETVEVVLRKQDDRHVLHLVNMAPGQHDVVTAGRRPYRKVTDIPPVPPCRVSVRLPARPTSVRLEPQGVPVDGWTCEHGRLEVMLPGFAIHQMLVIGSAVGVKRTEFNFRGNTAPLSGKSTAREN